MFSYLPFLILRILSSQFLCYISPSLITIQLIILILIFFLVFMFLIPCSHSFGYPSSLSSSAPSLKLFHTFMFFIQPIS